jgi:hypothetical protein
MNDDDDGIRAMQERFTFVAEDAKRYFGQWDMCDPVCWAIIRVVQAQNDFAHAMMQRAEGMGEGPVEQAITERLAAIDALQEAIEEEPRGFQ